MKLQPSSYSLCCLGTSLRTEAILYLVFSEKFIHLFLVFELLAKFSCFNNGVFVLLFDRFLLLLDMGDFRFAPLVFDATNIEFFFKFTDLKERFQILWEFLMLLSTTLDSYDGRAFTL